MIAYIPVATCQLSDPKIKPELDENIKNLNAFDFIDDVIVNATDEYYPRYIPGTEWKNGRGGDKDKRRYKAIARNTLECYQKAIRSDEEYFVMCNSTKMQKTIPRLPGSFEYIKNNPKCAVVSPSYIYIPINGLHIAAGCIIARTEAIKPVSFKSIFQGEWKGCHCIPLAQELRAKNWEVSYFYQESPLCSE